MLRVNNVTKSYGQRTILNQVSFVAHNGSVTIISGPNGAGKSTMLRCIADDETIDDGEILWHESPVRDTDPEFRRALSCVIDGFEPFPELTVFEQLQLVAITHGIQHAAELADDSLEAVNLGVVRDSLPGALSSGQYQRLRLAMGFLRPSELLLLDEPEQHLDAAGHEWLPSAIKQRSFSGATVIVVTHDATLAAAIGQQTIHLAADDDS